MPNKKSEIDTFFEDLPEADEKVADVFEDEQPKPEEGKVEDPDKEDAGTVRKNRQHRRLEEKLNETREMNIALAERVKILSEQNASKTPQELSTSEMPAEWVALYGNTPESQSAWKMQEKLFHGFKESAKQEAIREFEAKQDRIREEEKQFESVIDSQLELLEDSFDVDLTSNAPSARKTRREFLELVQKLSPKDKDGQITGYADFESTFEIYKNTREKDKPTETTNRQKEISTRSMQKPVGQVPSEVKHTPGFHGWKRDYKID